MYMHPAYKILATCWGLTEEQLKKIAGEGKLDDTDECETVELKIGRVFGNEDQNTTKISAVHVVLALKRLTPVILEMFVDAIAEVGEAFPSQAANAEPGAAAQDAELQRAVGDAAGEGMGTARPNTQAPNAHPWTPDDKIPN